MKNKALILTIVSLFAGASVHARHGRKVKNGKTLKEVAQEKWQEVQPQLIELKETVQEKWQEIQPKISEFAGKIQQDLQPYIQDLREKAQDGLAVAQEQFQSLNKETQERLKQHAQKFHEALQDLKDKILSHEKEGKLTPENKAELQALARKALQDFGTMGIIIGVVHGKDKGDDAQKEAAIIWKHYPKLVAPEFDEE